MKSSLMCTTKECQRDTYRWRYQLGLQIADLLVGDVIRVAENSPGRKAASKPQIPSALRKPHI